jgi:hypothetical protein
MPKHKGTIESHAVIIKKSLFLIILNRKKNPIKVRIPNRKDVNCLRKGAGS